MMVESLLPHAEFRPNDDLEDALHYTIVIFSVTKNIITTEIVLVDFG